jgi:hypothetical protein
VRPPQDLGVHDAAGVAEPGGDAFDRPKVHVDPHRWPVVIARFWRQG